MKDTIKQWGPRWLNPKAGVENSTIHGLGVFAKRKIRKGETVGVLGGIIVPSIEIKKYRKKMGHVGIQVDDDFFIVPVSRADLKKFGVFNHSCKPNLGFSSSITLIALKDIKPGDECVFDYAFCETKYLNFKCRCGTASCRGQITGRDSKIKSIQKKYGKYFSPYLRDIIKRQALT